MSSFSVDIDIDDVIWAMSTYDRRCFFEAMQDEGYISKSCVITPEGEVEAPAHIERNTVANSNDEFNQALQRLYGNGWRMTKEQEDYIIELGKRFSHE
jgi:hypothetical protein